jgi:hypothetical protein
MVNPYPRMKFQKLCRMNGSKVKLKKLYNTSRRCVTKKYTILGAFCYSLQHFANKISRVVRYLETMELDNI